MNQQRMNPLIAAAAVSLIIFSGVGIAVMTGVIPSSFSKSAETASVQNVTHAEAAKASAEAAKAPAEKAKAPAVAKSTSATAARSAEPSAKSAEPTKAAKVASAPAAKPAVCVDCGRIESINVIQEQGEGTGLGAVAGGVVGGLLGNQVGGGSGRKIATVAGAAGGAYAGHQIEKHAKSTRRYDVVVRMDNGSLRQVSYEVEPTFRVGDKVKIVNGMLVTG